MRIEFDGDPIEDRPEASLVRFREAEAIDRDENDLGSSGYRVWYYRFPDAEWLPLAALYALEPGESTGFRSHGTETDGPMERTYRVLAGDAELRTASRDEGLGAFDVAFCPAGAPHQLRNVGTERCWIASWVSDGGAGTARRLVETPPADRRGYAAEYERIAAARKRRDLPLTRGGSDDRDASPKDGPQPAVLRFSETSPVRVPESERVGASGRPTWFHDVDADWFHGGSLLKLEPGERVAFHSHLPETEGPFEDAYWVFDEGGELRTEYWDEPLGAYDAVHFPPGAAHQIRNAGTETLWFGSWTSVGGRDGAFGLDPATGFAPEDRPGYVDEYDRIMAARKERGLPLPPGVAVR